MNTHRRPSAGARLHVAVIALILLLTVALTITQAAAALQAPALTISDVSAQEQTGPITFTFTVTLNVATAPFTVDWGVLNLTTNAVDFSAIPRGTLSFSGAAGQARTLTVPVRDDSVLETDETFRIYFTNSSSSAVTITDTATGTIQNDETASLAAQSGTVSFGEAVGTAAVNLRLTVNGTAGGTPSLGIPASIEAYTVQLGASNAATANVDFTHIPQASPLTLTIPTGTLHNAIINTPITIVNDSIDEDAEFFDVEWINPTVATISGALIQVTARITDNDSAGVTVTQSGGSTTVSESQSQLTDTYTIRLNSQPESGTVTIGVTSDAQCTVTPATFNFTSANWSTERTFTVRGTDDTVVEGAHTCQITNDVTASDVTFYPTATSVSDITASVIDNDPGVRITNQSGLEATGGLTFSTRLNNGAPGAFTVDWAITHGTTVAADFPGIPGGTLTFAGTVGEVQTFTVPLLDDSILEANETFTVYLTNPSANAPDITDTAVGTIQNDETASLAAQAGTVTFGEGIGTANVNLVLSVVGTAGGTPSLGIPASIEAYTVQLGTSDAAIADVDFTHIPQASPLTVTIPAGALHNAVINTPIAIINDNLDELAEFFDVEWINPTVATISGAFIQVTARINDNDSVGSILVQSGGNTTVSESQGQPSDTYTIRLTSQPESGTVTIGVTFDAQCTVSPISADFTSANWSTPQTFTVRGVDDSAIEGPHTCIIINNVTASTAPSYTTATPVSNITADVIDNDPGLRITNQSAAEAAGGIGFSARLVNGAPGPFTVNWVITHGTTVAADFSGIPGGTLTFAGTVGEVQTFTVPVLDDSILEEDETFTVSFTNPSANAPDTNDSAVGTIEDDETASLAEQFGTVSYNEAVGTATVNLRLTVNGTAGGTPSLGIAASIEAYTVQLGSSDAAIADVDFTHIPQASPLTLTIPAGTLHNALIGTPIAITNDSLDENAEFFDVEWRNPTVATISGALVQVTARITDNDTAGVTVTQSGGTTVIAEGGGADSFTVRLNSEPSGTVTISAVGDADCTVSPASIDFTSANWSSDQTFTVTAVEDSDIEGAHTCAISNDIFASSDSLYPPTMSVTDITASVTDNDTANATISSPSLAEGDSGTTQLVFTITLNNPLQVDAMLEVTTGAGSASAGLDYTALTDAPVFISAGETSVTVEVTVFGDLVFEPDDNFFLAITSSEASGRSIIPLNSGEGTILNDDPPPSGMGVGG